MSFEALNWAWKVRGIPGPAKTVLARLACMTNGTGICWPSYTTLAADCCFDRRTVIRSINLLCEAGLVEKIPDAGPSNKYRLLVSQSHQVVTHSHQPLVTHSHQVVTACHQTSDTQSPKPIRTIKESKTTTPLPPKTPKPKPETPLPHDTAGQVPAKEKKTKKTTAPGFDDFWKVYPRKVARHAAEKAWLKKRPDIDAVLKAIKAQAQPGGPLSPEKKEYHPHPATWLNAGRWLDEADGQTEGPTIEPTNFDF